MSKYDWIARGSIAMLGLYVVASVGVIAFFVLVILSGPRESWQEWWQSLTTAQGVVIAAIIYSLIGSSK